MSTLDLFKVLTILLCIVAAFGMTGCKKNTPPLSTDFDNGAGSGAGGFDNNGSSEGLPNVNLGNTDFVSGETYGLQTVYFDYDSSAIRSDAMAVLSSNAQKINAVPGKLVQIAGHCDQRGTQEYNLALGERRALAVRDYLIKLGVSGNRLVTISYGTEMPAVSGNNEAAWSKNRRAEFGVSR